MCRLRNIAMRDCQESVTTGQTDGRTNRQTDRQTDAGQSDPYVPLCFAGDTKMTKCQYFDHTPSARFLTALADQRLPETIPRRQQSKFAEINLSRLDVI